MKETQQEADERTVKNLLEDLEGYSVGHSRMLVEKALQIKGAD